MKEFLQQNDGVRIVLEVVVSTSTQQTPSINILVVGNTRPTAERRGPGPERVRRITCTLRTNWG